MDNVVATMTGLLSRRGRGGDEGVGEKSVVLYVVIVVCGEVW